MYKKIKATKRPTKTELPEKWFLVDAEGKVLGRLASKIAKILIGKSEATYDPSITNSIKIVVINAKEIKLTGTKLAQKQYYRHSGYMGGLKTTALSDVMVKNPTKALESAISGMLPKNGLRKIRLANVKIYPGPDYPHSAQKPVNLEL